MDVNAGGGINMPPSPLSVDSPRRSGGSGRVRVTRGAIPNGLPPLGPCNRPDALAVAGEGSLRGEFVNSLRDFIGNIVEGI